MFPTCHRLSLRRHNPLSCLWDVTSRKSIHFNEPVSHETPTFKIHDDERVLHRLGGEIMRHKPALAECFHFKVYNAYQLSLQSHIPPLIASRLSAHPIRITSSVPRYSTVTCSDHQNSQGIHPFIKQNPSNVVVSTHDGSWPPLTVHSTSLLAARTCQSVLGECSGQSLLAADLLAAHEAVNCDGNGSVNVLSRAVF